ncbi:unnamed protein product [Calicophoron daubneyi]|uniref:Uncharacterized protein n=1 Tax=Calicophoron daubneyi TaxID=300641 RepID=A0AAV2TJT4_CALDB
MEFLSSSPSRLNDNKRDFFKTSFLHPDSYILSRPNVRRGFGGNYSRPNTGISMDRTQRFFTDSPIEQHRPILYNRSETSSSAASSDERRCNSVRGPRGRSNQKSPEVCTAYNQTSAMNGVVKRPFSQSCLPPACLSTPTFGWRCKTEREKQSDGKLLSLIEQLPPDRQSTVGFILLLMGIRQNDEKPTAQTVGGLEARLREALQLVSPEVASADKEVGIRADECPSTEGTKDGVLTPNHKSVSNGKPTNGMENNGSGESAMEDHSADLEMMTSQELKMDVENGMISTESNGEMATSDHNKPVLSNGSAESTKPGVATVLRRLARCMAIRLAYKRHHLANAQQKVAKNATEEKMLRNKLVGLISEVHHHGSLSNVRTTIDESQDTSTSLTDALTNNTLVTRFDRWHKNMASVIQLLCQLARRLAYVDARLRYVNDHRSGTDREQWRFPVDELDGETSESIKHQQEQLLTQIQEAQALRASFEKCRIRILEGIPGDLKVSAVTSSGPQSGKVGPLVQNGLPPADTKSLPNGNDNAAPTAGVNDQSPYLRDRVVIHLLSTVYWLLMYHMLDTQIRVDQELWDDIQDELRIEVSY